jgi:hypothetical protein
MDHAARRQHADISVQLLNSRQLQGKDAVHAPVALAAVRIMRALPEGTENWQLPKVLQAVANLVADRQQSVRDDARGVLVKIVRELGPAYMPYVCDVLTLALPARGFTAHVLGYTLHACLQVPAFYSCLRGFCTCSQLRSKGLLKKTAEWREACDLFFGWHCQHPK